MFQGSAIFPNEGRANCFDNPDRFLIKMQFPGDVDLLYFVAHDKKYRESITSAEEAKLFLDTQQGGDEGARNGIMFSGDAGRVFVNRGGIYGKVVDHARRTRFRRTGSGFTKAMTTWATSSSA